MTQQKVSFILSQTDKGVKVKIEFVPPLAGSEKFKTLPDSKKNLQTFASNIASSVMNAIKTTE